MNVLLLKAPEPAESWEDVLDGTVSNKICYQGTNNKDAIPTEDCLYVNVYTPVVSEHHFTFFIKKNHFWDMFSGTQR